MTHVLPIQSYYRKTTVVSKGFDLPITKDSCPLVRAGEFTPRRVESGRFTRKVLACGGSAAVCVNSESNCIFCWHRLICLMTGGARACEAFLKPQRHPLLVRSSDKLASVVHIAIPFAYRYCGLERDTVLGAIIS